ncbi:TPA: hypothetical protein LER87_001068 [Listeria monocytogenes]|uniref:hypothetical protein n=2 Tax=Listeria monocytogenes TaxID=1639 RepID=UPI00074D5B8A|nr:hypothetical protein [Listeria monocytogenes]EKE4550085.1 hypothetical protein [Listeria monocytogenes serotype 4b]EAC3023428.1 hypothetical protein [Listeria monocytogenes]EAD9200813.1 hypothetical protein [Listeria monocytogenes]EHH7730743.1 hypothetical protein [Listeria monocytogenes]EIL0039564.1 hypothetical protein [Listeria monocytogenes]
MNQQYLQLILISMIIHQIFLEESVVDEVMLVDEDEELFTVLSTLTPEHADNKIKLISLIKIILTLCIFLSYLFINNSL